MAALVVAYAWWAVSLPSFSGAATVVVVAGGLAAAASGAARRRPGPAQRGVRAGAWAWAVLAAATAAWQLAAYLQHPRADHPTLSSLANGLLDTHPARAAAFVLWLLGSAEVARR